MKIEKKYMFGFLAFAMVALVSAGLVTYYGQVEQDITIQSPIVFDGLPTTLSGEWMNTDVEGSLMTVENIAPFAVNVNIADDANTVGLGEIGTSYIGKLKLTKKTPNFAKDSPPWAILLDKVQIEYTIVGDKFEAEVAEGDVEAGYVLIYYADALDRFANPEEAILVEGNSFPYLPYNADMNSEFADEYDYCELDGYDTCHGAKIWYVPSNAIFSGGALDWTRASEFYFESSLIQYNADGLITVYPEEALDFTPLYELGNINGTYTITTTVDIV